MKTEDLFKWGVTPKSGHSAGKRMSVLSILPDGVKVRVWDGDEEYSLRNGEYELWTPPKTLFESDNYVTWGALKAAMEQEGLGDETPFYVCDYFAMGQAQAKIGMANGVRAVVFY